MILAKIPLGSSYTLSFVHAAVQHHLSQDKSKEL